MSDPAVLRYIEAIEGTKRTLFDRIHRIILDVQPGATVSISYGMPTYRVGDQRLFVGAWKHGLSIYGWDEGGDGGFLDRHPELRTSKGTVRLRPAEAEAISDAELRDLVGSALGRAGR